MKFRNPAEKKYEDQTSKRKGVNVSDVLKSWFETTDSAKSPAEEMAAIKEFAYRCFDELDVNENGYLEWFELKESLKNPAIADRDKKFIEFLIANQKQIADSYDEGDFSTKQGISRKDLDAYFSFIMMLLST